MTSRQAARPANLACRIFGFSGGTILPQPLPLLCRSVVLQESVALLCYFISLLHCDALLCLLTVLLLVLLCYHTLFCYSRVLLYCVTVWDYSMCHSVVLLLFGIAPLFYCIALLSSVLPHGVNSLVFLDCVSLSNFCVLSLYCVALLPQSIALLYCLGGWW